MSNNFTQLNPANNSGDYLTLKKSKEIYSVNSRKTKTNTKQIVKSKQNNFENQMLFTKGLRQNTACTVKDTIDFTVFPYDRQTDAKIEF
jgi:hypothetical protein